VARSKGEEGWQKNNTRASARQHMDVCNKKKTDKAFPFATATSTLVGMALPCCLHSQSQILSFCDPVFRDEHIARSIKLQAVSSWHGTVQLLVTMWHFWYREKTRTNAGLICAYLTRASAVSAVGLCLVATRTNIFFSLVVRTQDSGTQLCQYLF
jgi:hypothetical protein